MQLEEFTPGIPLHPPLENGFYTVHDTTNAPNNQHEVHSHEFFQLLSSDFSLQIGYIYFCYSFCVLSLIHHETTLNSTFPGLILQVQTN